MINLNDLLKLKFVENTKIEKETKTKKQIYFEYKEENKNYFETFELLRKVKKIAKAWYILANLKGRYCKYLSQSELQNIRIKKTEKELLEELGWLIEIKRLLSETKLLNRFKTKNDIKDFKKFLISKNEIEIKLNLKKQSNETKNLYWVFLEFERIDDYEIVF